MRSLAFALMLALLSFAVSAQPTIHTIAGYKVMPGGGVMKELITVALQPGVDRSTVAAKVLKLTKASPVPPYPLLAPNAIWPLFYATSADNKVLFQYYNPARDPTGGGGLAAVQHAQTTWNSVPESSFRFALAGNTTRCPSLSPVDCTTGALREFGGWVADGFNDIGWAPMSQFQEQLGVGVVILRDTRFNLPNFNFPFNGMVATEVDVQLNQDIAPYAYFTDGKHQIDLEESILAAEGIATGLPFSLDPQTVMYFGDDLSQDLQLPIRRALSAPDKAALIALYPKKAPVLTDAVPLARSYTSLATGYVEPGAINAQGDVAYVANASPPQVLFVASTDGIRKEIVRSGTTFAGVQLGDGSLDAVGLNDAGDTAFCWLVGPFEFPFGMHGGVFRARHKGLQDALVLPGVTPAPGGGVFVGCFAATISNQGDVAFTGLVQRDSAPVEYGAFVARRNGTIERVAGNGDPAPGGGLFAQVFFPRISPNGGNVAFDALTTDTSGYGVYVRRGQGPISAVARPGDAAAGGAITGAIRPRVNNQGQVLYAGNVQQSSGEGSWSLFRADGQGKSEVIARSGDVLPDGFQFDQLIISLNSWTLNDSGDAAFIASAKIQPVPFLPPWFETGIFATSGRDMRLLARSGAVGNVGSYLVGGEGLSATGYAALIDASGEVAFDATYLFNTVLLRASQK